MRVLITGAAGMLGQDVAAAASAAGHEVTAMSRRELDITDPAAVAGAIGGARPDVVINCAAYTNVDGAETEREQAHAVNGSGAGNVARAAAENGARIVHVSSDYVFDGSKRSPYVESDPTGPLSQYGSSKLAGEVAVARAAPGAHTIVRSAWLFGLLGPCFPATIMRLARERDELTVVDDQVGCPTFTPHLAVALVKLSGAAPTGIVHVAAGGQCSWFEFAEEIVTAAGADCEVKPGTTAELARPAPRPAYSVLGSEREHPITLPPWQEGVRAHLAALEEVASR
jgi:dTDP-4-dehydrorhamnose reductase